MNDYEGMIGKKIEHFVLTQDGDLLTLFCEGKIRIELEPEGDCCSTTWIESIDFPVVLIDAIIMKVEDRDMPGLGDVPGVRNQSIVEVKYYGLAITTNKGVCVIDYRNSSNGYYGGWVNARIIDDSQPKEEKP